MAFQSILFENPENVLQREIADSPDSFDDLNLDQIVDTITAAKGEYDLKPLFYAPLHDVDKVAYRHEVVRDLENGTLFANIKSFAQSMKTMRSCFARGEKAYYAYEKERWFLDAVDVYCDAVNCLVADLSAADLKSRGMTALLRYLEEYTDSDRFVLLLHETKKIQSDLAGIRYSVLTNGLNVKVQKYDSESDYSAEVEATFSKFQQGAVSEYLVKIPDHDLMNHVEAKILERVALLFPDIFGHLDSFCATNEDYLDEVVRRLDREIQFYVSYLDYIAIFRNEGLGFCLPRLSDRNKEIHAYETFDAALAYKLIGQQLPTVRNDFYLKGRERILVVSGPNQGGKTTFARMFGQLHYLASLGCPVPGSDAQLFLYDRLFTHFENEEKVENLHGKLEDDLLRIHSVLEQATGSSIVIMNEIFNSTTLQDAIFLGEQVMRSLINLDLIGVCVTFIDELAFLSDTVVSMASTVVPENPAERTFKIVRKPADGLAYAISVAEKYGLTYDRLKERLAI